MMDFLKANPHVTREQYLWNWTIPQIRLASFDSTHIEYTNKKDKNKKKNPSAKEKAKQSTQLDSPEAVERWLGSFGNKH